MGEQAALGLRGRARRVHQHRDVADPHPRLEQLHVVVGHAARGRGERVAAEETGALAVQVHERAQQRRRLEPQRARVLAGRAREDARDEGRIVHRLLRAGRRQQHADVRVRDHVAQLVLLEAPVDRHGHCTELRRPDERSDEVDLVRHQDPDLVARADAEAAEGAREAVGEGGQLGEGDPLAREDDGVAVRLRRGAVDEVADRSGGDGHALHVAILQSADPAIYAWRGRSDQGQRIRPCPGRDLVVPANGTRLGASASLARSHTASGLSSRPSTSADSQTITPSVTRT